MGETILGPAGTIPYKTNPVVVQTKTKWGGKWKTEPGLMLETATRNAGGNDLDSAVFLWKYGNLAHPWDKDLKQYKPLGLDGDWIRVCLTVKNNLQTLWIGRIYGEGRNIHGSDTGAENPGDKGFPSGVQRWQAYGPQMIFRKISISQSLWAQPEKADLKAENWLGWLPDMNDRVGQHALLVGNRSGAKHSGKSYIFGGTDIWSAYDFVEYVLAWYCDFSATGGPKFKLGGQADLLKSLTYAQAWPETTTADHILRKLISPRFGVDFKIDYSDSKKTFTVNVFSLQSKVIAAGDAKLPANLNKVRVKAGESPANLSTTIAVSSDHKVHKIRVLGKRVVVCCSLLGSQCDGPDDPRKGAIDMAWNADDERAYNEGNGAPAPSDAEGLLQYPIGSAERADYIRRDSRFRDVFSLWLMPKSFDLTTISAAIMLDDKGTPSVGAAGNLPPRQLLTHKTLHWLPLQSDYDYSVWPPTKLDIDSDTDYAPQMMPPQVWIRKDKEMYQPAHMAGIHVGIPRHGLGVRLTCNPRHLLGKDNFLATAPTCHEPIWNAAEMVTTIAFESDARLALEYEVPGSDPLDGIEEIILNDAEMWVLTPKTLLQTKTDSGWGFFKSPDRLAFTRDDRPRMGMVLAGAIARYGSSRCRAEIVAAGITPWQGLLGQILTTIESGGMSSVVEAPITQISWSSSHDGGLPRTTIRTGFANRE